MRDSTRRVSKTQRRLYVCLFSKETIRKLREAMMTANAAIVLNGISI